LDAAVGWGVRSTIVINRIKIKIKIEQIEQYNRQYKHRESRKKPKRPKELGGKSTATVESGAKSEYEPAGSFGMRFGCLQPKHSI